MGVDIALFGVEQKGRSSRRRRIKLLGAYIDKNDLFAQACSGTDLPMLARVKPYGSLVLHPDEMDQFVDELFALDESRSAEFLDPIFSLAERCSADPDTELHLDGD